MNERDLREALAPLQGDPVQDAARVLAALPPVPPGAPKGKPLPPLAWWLLGSGLVLGAIVGLWLGRGTAPAAKPEVKPAVPTKAEEPVKPPAAQRDEYLYLMSMGGVQIDEPGFGTRSLGEGSSVAVAGTTVTTAGKPLGVHVLGTDARLHLDIGTVATITTTELRIRKGRVSVSSGMKEAEMRVVSDLATVQLQRGSVVVERQPDALAVQAVRGVASVRTPGGQTAQVEQGLQVLVHATRGMGEAQKIPPGDWALTWMNQQPPKEAEGLYLMAFGSIHIDEPGVGPQDLAPNVYGAALGTTVTTGAESQAGLLVNANDLRVRLDHETVATIDTGEVRIRSGRVWTCTGNRETDIRIESDLATIAWRRGCVIAIRMPQGLAVVAVDGEIIVRTKGGQTAKLNRGVQVFADADRGLSALEKVPFLGTATSWMTHMILQGQDETELKERVAEMVEAFTEGSQREAAASELRKLGARCTGALIESIGKRPLDRDLARAAAAVAAAVSDYRNSGWLFKLLEHDDEEVRVLAHRGIVRVTSTDGGTDETFWRTAAVERRQAAATSWWKSLK